MLLLKNKTLNGTDQAGIVQSRAIFAFDVGASEAYKKLQETAAQAGNLERWKSGPGAARTELEGQRNAAIQEVKGKIKEETDKIDKDEKTAIDAVAKNVDPGQEPKNKKSKEWKEWDDKVKANKDNDAKREQIKSDNEAKRNTLKAEQTALEVRMNTLAKVTADQVEAAFKAKDEATKVVKDKVTASVEAGMDSADMNEAREAADFAEDLADADYVKANYSSGLVNDYLKSEMNGVMVNGEKVNVTMGDQEVEDLTMGIVARLHEKGKEHDMESTARKFMSGLSQRESDSGGILEDNGVKASDIKLQIMQSMGYDVSNRDARQLALSDKVSGTIDSIMCDQKVPSQLRGMLLGELAKASPAQREQAVQKVAQMYAMLKSSGAADEGEMTSKYTRALQDLGMDIGAVGMATGAGILFPPFALIGAGSSLAEILNTEADLTKAAGMFMALEDANKVANFQNVLGGYKQLVAATGKPDPNIEKFVAENCKTPAEMEKNQKALEGLIKVAESTYRATEVARVSSSPEMKKLSELSTYFGVEFPYKASMDALGNAKASLPEFQAAKAQLETELKSGENAPTLMEKAKVAKDMMNKKIEVVQKYQTELAAAKAKDKGGKKTADLPQIPDVYGTPIAATSPSEIKSAVEKIADIDKAVQAAQEATAKLAEVNKKLPQGGGGGGGEYAAPAPAAKPAEAPAVQAEKQKDRPNNFAKDPYKPENTPGWYTEWAKNTSAVPKEPGFYVAKRGKEQVLVEVREDKDKKKTDVSAYPPNLTA